jgi:hypothetical protein
VASARLAQAELLRVLVRLREQAVGPILILRPSSFEQPLGERLDRGQVVRPALVLGLRLGDEPVHRLLGLDDPLGFLQLALLVRVADVPPEPAGLPRLVEPAAPDRRRRRHVLHPRRQRPIRGIDLHGRVARLHRQIEGLHGRERLHQLDELVLLGLDAHQLERLLADVVRLLGQGQLCRRLDRLGRQRRVEHLQAPIQQRLEVPLHVAPAVHRVQERLPRLALEVHRRVEELLEPVHARGVELETAQPELHRVLVAAGIRGDLRVVEELLRLLGRERHRLRPLRVAVALRLLVAVFFLAEQCQGRAPSLSSPSQAGEHTPRRGGESAW